MGALERADGRAMRDHLAYRRGQARAAQEGDAVDWLAANPAATTADIAALPCIEGSQGG
jgi:hypothetical protein